MLKKKGKNMWKKNERKIWKAGLLLGLLSIFMNPSMKQEIRQLQEMEQVQAQENSSEHQEMSGGGAAITDQSDETGYAAILYDATNGLPTSDANTILVAEDGFIWIGSYGGLIRYDGTSFERQDSSGGITNVTSLYEDSRGRLWVGTNDNGVVVIQNGESWHFDYKDGLDAASVRSIAEDSDGNILLGTTQGVFFMDENMEVHSLNDPQLKDAFIVRLIADEKGNIFGNTKNGAVFEIQNLKITSHYMGEDVGIGKVKTVFPDPKHPGMMYLGTESGEVEYGSFEDHLETLKEIEIKGTEEQTEAEEESVSEKPVNWISYASGKIWVICDDTIGYLDEDHTYHMLQNLLLNSAIDSMTEDYEGNLWFTSSRQGVMKIVADKFSNITEHAALEPQIVNSTCWHQGNLYIGTDNGIQIKAKDHTILKNELTEYIGDSRIRCIMEDQDENLWISTYTNDCGLVCYTADGKIKSYTEEDGMLSNQTRGTAIASDGSVLEATNGGVVVIKNGEIVRTIGESSGLDNTVILTVEEGLDGAYYLGTDGDGIYVADGNNITHIGREEGLTSDVILRIKKDEKRGVLWLVTSNSIEYIKDGVITEVENFPYTNNYDLYFDQEDNVWVLASNGIYVVKAQDMIENGKFEYLLYDFSSGLPDMPTVNSYNDLDEDGTLYVSGRTGVYSVNINQYFEKTHDIKLNVPYVEANGVRYYQDENKTITIPPSAKSITIYGYALTYDLQNPRIQYFLSGLDKEAAQVSKQNMEPVRYTNVKGGKYIYQLSVVNISTGEIQQTMEVAIVKEKAWYEVLWFNILCIIFAIFIVEEMVRLHIRRKMKALLKKQEEDKLLIREIVMAFSKTIDMKDKYTNGHSGRVAEYTVMLARELGYEEEVLEKYYNIALLHDIGKIGVPEEVLNKKGKLTDEEFKIIKSHTIFGYDALKEISIMPELAIGAGAHHERPDGKGYPNGLSGEEIPRVAQIIAVADTFDAMYSDRPYRKRMNFDRVVSIMKEVSGTQLASDVVEAFLRLVEKGEFKDPKDQGGGSMEDINNIHKRQERKE